MVGKRDPNRRTSLDTEAVDHLLIDLFLEAHKRAPRQIILDLDATDDPLHGNQEGRLFHGYYNGYCYLPLYIFCGEHLLCARLRLYRFLRSTGAARNTHVSTLPSGLTWLRGQGQRRCCPALWAKASDRRAG